MVILLV